MKKRNVVKVRFVILLLSFFFATQFLYLAAQQKAAECEVQIVSPQAGNRVSAEGMVEGTANMPAGKHLWIFAHRKGLALWWPEGGGPALVQNGRWQVLVTFGLPRDAGSDFEITAAVVDDARNAELLNWVKKAEETGNYPGIVLPASVSGCLVRSVIVTKQ